jgi:AcrR family transcriptional regulator
MKTIRQIADEIGVSKQAVFKKIKREPLSTSLQGLTATVDGRLMVEVDGEKLIKQAFSEIAPSTTDNQLTVVDGLVDGASTPNAEKTAEVDGVISVLQATIDTLQGQLEVKDRQIEQQAQTITRLTDALAAAQQTAAAAQALHAGTIQQQLITGEAGVDQQEPEQKKSWFSKIFGGR